MGFLKYLVTESWAFLRVYRWRLAILLVICGANALNAVRHSTWWGGFMLHLCTAVWAYDFGRDVAKHRAQDRIDRLRRMYHSLEAMEPAPAARRANAMPPADPIPRPGPGRKRGEWA